MRTTITVHESACRGCGICDTICPTKVFSMNDATRRIEVAYVEDCIGCLSCSYVCPSGAIRHDNVVAVKDFTRSAPTLLAIGKYL